jgi:hypothetical protein
MPTPPTKKLGSVQVMAHSVTAADVQRVYGQEVERGKNAKEARQGTRTVIQGMLQAQLPTPYSDQPTLVAAALQMKRGLTAQEVKALRDHQFAQVTEADMIASEKARMGVDATHRDAHHYVQKTHQKSLWEEADRLVNATLGGAS